MCKCNKIPVPLIRTTVSQIVTSKRKLATFPFYPHSPTINRYTPVPSLSQLVPTYEVVDEEADSRA